MTSSNAKEWTAAAEAEYHSLIENNTWSLVKLPPGRSTVGCKWVFKTKHHSDGTVDRYKGRLVAKGFTQKSGIDYHYTFSPVVRHSSIRALLAYGLNHNMIIHQMDVVTAFLNGKLEEEIYMDQPEGFIKPGTENLVCKLHKSIYGLKQSPRCWNLALDVYLKSLNFVQSTADPCVYVKTTQSEKTIIAVYVDDLIIMSDTNKTLAEVKLALSDQFKMKDMGQLHHCLGLNIEQTESKILLDQQQYIEQIINRFGMQDAYTVTTPADSSVKLVKDDGISKPVDPVKYQEMVGSLIYAAVCTRPDIAQAVGEVSKYNAHPTEAHLTAVKRIIRYLKGTSHIKLTYQKSDNKNIIGYSDANWAGDLDNRHSTSGNVFLMGGGAISWLSKRQNVVAASTAEAEYISLFHATQEAAWLQRLITDIDNNNGILPIQVMVDNQAAIAMSKNASIKPRTKHIDKVSFC